MNSIAHRRRHLTSEPIIEAGVEVEPPADRIVGRVSLEKIKGLRSSLIRPK